MLVKLINTLKYGSFKTKRKLYLMLAFFVVGIGFLIAAVVLRNKLFALIAFIVILVDGLTLANTSFEQKSVSVKKSEKRKKEEDDTPGALEWVSSEKEEKQEENKDKQEEKNPLVQYDEKKIKKLFVKYKVKKEHVTILIDDCRTERVFECPAYMWKDRVYLYFLLLDKEPRMIKFPCNEIGDILVRRGVMARPAEEYKELQENPMIQMVFGNLLPKYYQKGNSYRNEYKKNLYSIAPNVWCTSGSVNHILKILPARFSLEDNYLANVNIYYKEIYTARMLFFDGILSPQQYKEKVLETLSTLVKSDLSNATIQDYLSQMMMTGLLPKEYADFALSKRK